jgi:putative nucleotidyltransferase with HDIG domain
LKFLGTVQALQKLDEPNPKKIFIGIATEEREMDEISTERTGPIDGVEEQPRLYRILARANRIASHTELDELLYEMLELIALICGADAGTLYLLDRATGELEFKVVLGDVENQLLVGKRISSSSGIAGITIRQARPIVVKDLQSDPRWLGFVADIPKELKNAISIPLLLRGEAIGVVQVFNFSHTPLQLIQLLGNRMASEIEKAVLLRASNQRGKRLETLVKIIKEMSSTLDRDQLLNSIITAARELLNAEGSSLFLIDETSGDLILNIASNLHEISLPHIRVPAGQGIIGHVIDCGEPVLVSDVGADNRHYSGVDRTSGLETQSILAVPLRTPTVVLGSERGVTESKIIGGIEAINKLEGGFNEADIQVLTTLADQAATVLLLARLYQDANDLFFDSIKAITAAIDAKDPYTRGHSQRVSDFSTIMAKELGLPTEIVHHIRVGGLLHDVGKIGIPDTILTKPDRLSDEEFERMKTHPTIGANIMKEVRMLQSEIPALAEHHERMDGKGYPNGLIDEQISLAGRIVAVADVFDALTSDRPYREALSAEEALEILSDNRDTHLDSQCVDAFIDAYLKGKIKTQREQEHLQGQE